MLWWDRFVAGGLPAELSQLAGRGRTAFRKTGRGCLVLPPSQNVSLFRELSKKAYILGQSNTTLFPGEAVLFVVAALREGSMFVRYRTSLGAHSVHRSL
jgi:hypothetical protein